MHDASPEYTLEDGIPEVDLLRKPDYRKTLDIDRRVTTVVDVSDDRERCKLVSLQ